MERRPIRTGSTAMHSVPASSSSATGTRGGRLPLVDCPRCGVRVNMIRSKQPESYGELFFVCPNNIKEDPRTCKFLRSHAQYQSYLRDLDEQQVFDGRCEAQPLGDANMEIRKQFIEMQQGFENMKLQLHELASDICILKLKSSGFQPFGIHTAVAVALCVGVLLGILATAFSKAS